MSLNAESSSRRLGSTQLKIINYLASFYGFLPTSFVRFIWYFGLNSEHKAFLLNRFLCLKSLCPSVGVNVYIGANVVIKGHENLSIGDNVSIHSCCYIDASGGIVLKNDISIAHQTSILSSEHTWGDPDLPIKYNPVEFKKTIINDDVWVGCGARILGGVTINSRSIVASGAVVVKNVPASKIVGGVPAKVIKSLGT